MENRKIIIAAIIGFIIVLSFCQYIYYNDPDIKYLSNKYNEKFYYVTSNIDNIPIYRSKSHPEYDITVSEVKGKYFDNYYNILVYDQMYNYLEKLLSKQLTEFKFYYANKSRASEEMKEVSKLEEYIENYPEYFETTIFIYIPSSASNLTETQKEQLVQPFKDRNLSFIIDIYEVPDEEYQKFGDVDIKEYTQYKFYKTIFSDSYYSWH